MGTWGSGTFENDWALDWAADLRESPDHSPILTALEQVVVHGGTKYSSPSILERLRGLSRHTDWLTANVAARALAAAEVVSASLGRPPKKLPDGISGWLQQHACSFPPDLSELALRAVMIVKTSSELKDLWEEGNATEWRNGVEDLERRLHN